MATTNEPTATTSQLQENLPPPSAEDEQPTEDWTVEQVLQLLLRQADEAVDVVYDELIRDLKAQHEAAVQNLTLQVKQQQQGLGDTHKENNNVSSSTGQVASSNNSRHHPPSSPKQQRKKNPNHATNQSDAATTTTAPTPWKKKTRSARNKVQNNNNDKNQKTDTITTLAVKVGLSHRDEDLDDSNTVVTYVEVRLSDQKEAGVGRSRLYGKRGGISMPHDLEMSSDHGKFHVEKSKSNDDDWSLFFTDLSSSNGTELNGTPIDAETPMEVSVADILVCGATRLHIVEVQRQEE